MSLDLETRLRNFYASAPPTRHEIETLEISHSAMSKTYHLWREPYAGTTTVAGVVKTMRPANIENKRAGSPGHLDQKFDIKLGLVDAMDEFRDEMDRIPVDTEEMIILIYRVFMSDDLSTVEAQANLQIESISYVMGAASISAVSPRLNITRTGEVYAPKEIPMLRGFL